MPFTGSAPNKTYQRTDGTRTGSAVNVTAKGAGVNDTAALADNRENDMATAISTSWQINGDNQPSANLPMNSKKFTGMAQGSARTDSLRIDQVQDGDLIYAEASGTANAIALTTTPTCSPVEGMLISFFAEADNTDATTVDLNGDGAVALQAGGNACAGGEVNNGQFHIIGFDGTQWQLVNPFFADGFISTARIDDLAVTTAKINDDAVTTDKILDDAVTTAKILDENVTNAKLADMAEATIKGREAGAGTGVPTDLTAAQVLEPYIEDESAPVALSDAATVAVDWSAFITATLTLGGNRTLSIPTNEQPGTYRTIEVASDGTNRTLAFAANYRGLTDTITGINTGTGQRVLITIYSRASAGEGFPVVAGVVRY